MGVYCRKFSSSCSPGKNASSAPVKFYCISWFKESNDVTKITFVGGQYKIFGNKTCQWYNAGLVENINQLGRQVISHRHVHENYTDKCWEAQALPVRAAVLILVLKFNYSYSSIFFCTHTHEKVLNYNYQYGVIIQACYQYNLKCTCTWETTMPIFRAQQS